ncbi:MAG: PAS domain-containing sensor histidine kinase [Proteobacteria bacterium]|nr:PAS domain-containing sensor histidine kinase [Pseudomonadota bacterium]
MTGIFMTFITSMLVSMAAREALSSQESITINSIENRIRDRLAGIEDSMKVAGTVLSLSDQRSGRTVLAEDKKIASIPGLGSLDRLMWITQAGSGWISQDVIHPRGEAYNLEILMPESAQSLVNYFLYNRLEGVSETIVTTDMPGTKYIEESSDPLIKSRSFAVARVVDRGAAGTGIIVGVTRFTRLLDDIRRNAELSVDEITVRDIGSGRPVFFMSRNGLPRRDYADPYSTGDRILSFGTIRWEVMIKTNRRAHGGLLRNAYFFVLVLGLGLTVVGAVYVRNYNDQSTRLLTMGNVLAQRNFDFSVEVTERERLDQVLRKTEREYKAIIGAVSDIIFEVSADGIVIFLNESWKNITGFDVQETIGMNIFDFLHPQDKEEQRNSFLQMVKGQKNSYHSFVRLRTYSDIYRYVDLHVSIVRQDENKNMRIIGTLSDIEDRRKAEKALSEAEKKYRTIVEHAADGLYQLSPEGKFVSANPAMADILGYDSADDLIHGVYNAHEQLYENVKDRMQFLKSVKSADFIRGFEAQIIRKDGQRIWINENARVVKGEDGRVLYYEGSVENITKRKDVELKLREAKIQSDMASRAKSEFLANMSHELRTPLNAIIGFSEIIKNQVLGPVENKQYWEYACDIFNSGKRLLAIINEILDISKIDAGERQLNESSVNLEKTVKICVDLMMPKVQESQKTVINLVDRKAPLVIGEDVALKQIVLNLLSNAVKFTPEGGRITISYEVDAEGNLRLSVTDTGIGLSEEEIEKALSPFGQVESSFARSGSGAGLGLTLVNALIKLHGGRLELFSQKGIGTTATIIIPAKRVAAKEKAGGEAGDNRFTSESGNVDWDTIPPRNLQ